MRTIMKINVTIHGKYETAGKTCRVVMIPFAATAEGVFFRGRILFDGTDTQHIGQDGSFSLSARYMLEGTDMTGRSCRVCIENNGSSLESCVPRIVTDSPELAFLEEAELRSSVQPTDTGVIVTIYEV